MMVVVVRWGGGKRLVVRLVVVVSVGVGELWWFLHVQIDLSALVSF